MKFIASNLKWIPGGKNGRLIMQFVVKKDGTVGVFDSFQEVKRFLKFEKTVKPVKEHREDYEKLMPVFDEAYHCMLPLYKKMAKL